MLLYQNATAAEGSLKGSYYKDPAVLRQLAEFAFENRLIDDEQSDGSLLPLSRTARLLGINKECRRLYDLSASRYVEAFDQAHTPQRGWHAYLSDRE